jgi:hypothetical protein
MIAINSRLKGRFKVQARGLCVALLLVSSGAQAQEGYAISGVNVVPMDREAVLENQTVLVKSNRITAILPADNANIPAGYERIDGQGRFLAPGLADMHAHPMTQENLDAFLASGVTLIRAMWGEPIVLQMRKEVEMGERAGPRIIAGGRIVDGEPVIHYGSDQVMNPADAKRVVQQQKAAAYDFIKVYSNLSLEAFDAIAEAAANEGIPYAGHVPHQVPMSHALQAGMQTSEHLTGVADATLREGQTYVWNWSPEFAPFAERVGKGELTVDQLFDAGKLAGLAALSADTGHWLVPTLVVLRGVSLDPEQMAAEFDSPDMRYTDYTVKSFWRLMSAFGPPQSEAFYAGRLALFAHNLKQVKAFHDAGARILAGTDALNPFVNVGFSVVQEMQLFVDAGMTTFEALKTATVNAAEFAGEAGTAGVIAEGARADLVLLDANPLEDVAAYREIAGVWANGHWHDRADLDQRLAAMEAKNERKAAVFAADATWTVQEGEFVPMYAGFETFEGDQKTGTERIARTYQGEAASALLAERRSAGGGMETWRAETNAEGQIARLQIHQEMNGRSSQIDLRRTETGFEVSDSSNTANTARAVASEAGLILTHSALDSLLLQPVMSGMADGETREVQAMCLDSSQSLSPCTATLTRHPADVIIGHFYFSGVNPIDVRVESGGAQYESRFMMGGGFYAGWPVRLELGHPSATAPVVYRRLL